MKTNEPNRPLATVYFKNGDVVAARLIGYIFDSNEDVSAYKLEGITVEIDVIDLISIDYGNMGGNAE